MPVGPPPITARQPAPQVTNDELTIRRLADYEKLSAIFWLILGILQVLTVLGIIAGIWNIFAAYSRFQVAPLIKARDPSVPSLFESMAGIIIIGIVNLVLGGVIGVLFAVFDFIVRDQVLKNRHLFDGTQSANTVAMA